MKIQILVGVMIMSTAVFAEQITGTGKNEKREPTVVDIEKKLAMELVKSRQAKPVKSSSVKANFEVKQPEAEIDELDEFFDGDDDDLEPEEE